MFDSILIRPNSGRSHSLDFGQVVENLFFYKKTIVHIGKDEIPKLYDLAEVDVLETLLTRYNLSIFYNNSYPAIMLDGERRLVTYTHLDNLDIEKVLYQEAFLYNKNELRSRKFAKKLSRLVGVHEYANNTPPSLTAELKNDYFLKQVTATILRRKGLYKEDGHYRYELEFLDANKFVIHTDIDTSNPNLFNADVPVLALINAVEDLQVMAEAQAEISLPEYDALFVRLKAEEVFRKGAHAQKEIDVFNHYVFDESWALREAINSKRLHVRAVLKVLDKAHKYKEWLQSLNENSNVMAEYVAKVEEKSVLESLPFRSIRFYIFNALNTLLGQANPSIAIPFSVALSALDSFLLDAIEKKWKPNQFVVNELRPLLKDGSQPMSLLK